MAYMTARGAPEDGHRLRHAAPQHEQEGAARGGEEALRKLAPGPGPRAGERPPGHASRRRPCGARRRPSDDQSTWLLAPCVQCEQRAQCVCSHLPFARD